MNKKCQVFTPTDYVEELLDSVGYTENLYGKKILENSCGDGNILVAVVRRYIDDCRKHGLSRTKIKNGLSKDVYGVEIDPEQYAKCVSNLNDVLKKNGIKQIEWKLFNVDYLRWNNNTKFDFIVGNPPYITYRELEEKEQIYVKTTFKTCIKGKFDYCYAFIEKSIDSLTIEGKISYLIPSSIFKTVFGANLRSYMRTYIEEVRDFTQEKMFDDALVKSAIMVLNHNRQNNNLHYIDMTAETDINIPIMNLGNKWFFTENTGRGSRTFGEYFQVSHVVATLLNKVYVLKEEDYKENNEFYECNGFKIERSVIRETASPRSLRYNKIEKIIFPYYYENNLLKRYNAEEFETHFPGAFGYLNKYREQLDARESDNSAKWFEYGRSQALNGINKEKLLVSTIITSNVSVYLLNQQCIPYAGMYITVKDNNNHFTLDDAMHILQSREFMQYVMDVGIHISGCSLRITSKDIADYKF